MAAEGPSLDRAVSLWRGSLGLAPQDSTSLEGLLQHVKTLSSVLAAHDVSRSTICTVESVFKTALELCLKQQNGIAASASQEKARDEQEEFDSHLHYRESLSGSDSNDNESRDGSHHAAVDAPERTSSLLDEDIRRAGDMTGERAHAAWEHGGLRSEGSSALFASNQDGYALYDKFGGWEGLAAAVGSMYTRLCQDTRTARFFTGRQYDSLMRHMTAFIGTAMLGRCMYSPADLRRRHCAMIEHEGMGPEHVDIMCSHLEEVLRGMGIAEATIQAATCVLQQQKCVFDRQADVSGLQGAPDVALGDVERVMAACKLAAERPGMAQTGRCPFARGV